MAVTARIASSQGGDESTAYQWSIEYDDVTQRVTGQGTGAGNVTVVVQITKTGGTRKVQFLQPGRQQDADTDFAVVMGSGDTLLGPAINPNQVTRIVGKVGTVVGGLPFQESWTRA